MTICYCNIYLLIISILFTFVILIDIPNLFALENNKNNISMIHMDNAVNQSLDNRYNYEPFLSLNGTDYLDISSSNILSLENFTIASWIKVNESNLLKPAILVNKGGFNSDKKGMNMNYGLWFSSEGKIQGGSETESGEYYAANSTAKYYDGKWHYIVLSKDGYKLRLYIE